MVKDESKESKQEEKPATESQIKLIKELYDETNYSRQYPPEALELLGRDEASKHIHLLKETKVRDQALRSVNEPVPQFDKIGFGMVYKLVWRQYAEKGSPLPGRHETFEEMVCGEYKLFKHAQEACRQFVADGGLK